MPHWEWWPWSLGGLFLDSLATLDMPGYGYGINYEYGLFKQEIDAGYQRKSR
jgi:starch phosphorylase